MILRDPYCDDCRRSTAGDCGMHGTTIVGSWTVTHPCPDCGELRQQLAGERAACERAERELDNLNRNLAAAADRIVEFTNQRDRLAAALRSIAANSCCDRCQEAALVAQAALRERA